MMLKDYYRDARRLANMTGTCNHHSFVDMKQVAGSNGRFMDARKGVVPPVGSHNGEWAQAQSSPIPRPEKVDE
jgi:hypothetical protein